MTNVELLKQLDFGSIDSESEFELDKKFLKTQDFENFLIPKNALILGAKGSGKSALFEMFAKYEGEVREMAGEKLDDVFIVTGTGFKDLKELQTDDMKKLMQQDSFDFEDVWKLYIAIKIALKLGEKGYYTGKILCEFLKQAGQLSDYRILPILRSFWKLIVGTPPEGIEINTKGFNFKINKASIDTMDLLNEINEILEEEGKFCWILFDKIDELFATNFDKRKECIESLFSVYLQFVQAYPRIKLKIFLRTDIWNTLNFVNKSHIADKMIKIEWDNFSLVKLILKRICTNNDVKLFLEEKNRVSYDELLRTENIYDAFYSIFESQVYKGAREAKVIDWIVSRITDGLHGRYPREMINFCNAAKDKQLEYDTTDCSNFLISGNAIKEAYYDVSTKKCTTYLSEFPDLHDHFDKFNGQTTPKFTRKKLKQLMRGLKPSGDAMIKQLYDIGILLPVDGISSNATEFEIPRLFRAGLSMVIKGRP